MTQSAGEFRGQDYRVGRHLETPADFYEELQRVSAATRGRIKWRGVFNVNTISRMRPAPAVGDLWFIEDLTGSDHYLYLQVDDNPRLRLEIANVSIVKA